MSCGTALEARRNSDERWTFTPSSRNYTFSGMAPLFTVRRGETVLLQIDQTQTVNGSLFSVVGDSVVLQLKKGDAALLDGPTPDTDAESLFYDVTLTDQTGFENWIVGGPFTLLGLNDVSCGGCNEKVEVTLGGQCIQINIEGGNLGIGSSVNLAALNKAVQDAETAAGEAAQSAAEAATAGATAGAAAGSVSGAAAGADAGTDAAEAVVTGKANVNFDNITSTSLVLKKDLTDRSVVSSETSGNSTLIVQGSGEGATVIADGAGEAAISVTPVTISHVSREPVYSMASGVLAASNMYTFGNVTIPAGKQFNIVRVSGGVVSGGNRFKTFDSQFTVQGTTDAYNFIGAVTNIGPGTSKSVYGRAIASAGCTGVVMGAVAAVTIEDGVTPDFAAALQINHDGLGSASDGNNIGIFFNSSDGVKNVDYGFLSANGIGYKYAMIRGYRANGQTGDFAVWRDAATGRDLFKVDAGGNVALGSTGDGQRTLSFFNSAREWTLQGVNSGDGWRLRDSGAGRDVISTIGGAAGAANAVRIWVGSALRTVEVGAPDSGGAGYRMLRVLN